MRNIIQYASGFAALGCRLNFDTTTGELTVVDIPKDKRKIIVAAIADIEKFEDTANYADGMAIFVLADEIDGDVNPFIPERRSRILSDILGYTNNAGKFYKSVINSIKVQRSWHLSAESNTCTYFGEICTNRGIDIPDGRRGRKSYRSPDQYHMASSRGIAREQLVTPNLAAMYAAIPEDRLVTLGPVRVNNINIEDAFRQLTPEQAAEWIKKLESRL